MAPRLPDRYQTQVRLGRDGDVEEWLATDTSLDRPVLVRALDPAADGDRRRQFVENVRAAAAVSHMHLTKVFEVNADANVYAIVEWNGGVSVADRLRAGDTLPVNEFLPNAAGLAEGLAAMHAAGVVHGSVDTSAIRFSSAHPAKLGALGRAPIGRTPADDIRGLAIALRQGLTGSSTPDLRPSQVVEGLPRTVDDAIIAAEKGTVTAASLAASLRAAPFRPETPSQDVWTWRWVPVSVGLLLAALAVALVGLSIDVDPDSPFLFPATPQVAAGNGGGNQGTAPPPVAPEGASPVAVSGTSFDPFGDNQTEREPDVPLAYDGDLATAWRTERYFSPLGRVKPGVGLLFTTQGPVSSVEISGSPGTELELGWSSSPPSGDDWERLGSATLELESTTIEVDTRDPGTWVLWLTDLPE